MGHRVNHLVLLERKGDFMAEKNTAPVIEEEKTTVTIKLPKDRNEKREDMVVGLNGKMFLIRRGEYVDVPIAVAEIIENSEIQDNKTLDLIEKLSSGSPYNK